MKMKRWIALLLAVVVVLPLVPIQAVHVHAAEDITVATRFSAEDFRLGQQCRFYRRPATEVSPLGENETEWDTTIASGTYENNCQWLVDSVDGLFIRCDGAMENQSSAKDYPWYAYRYYCDYIYVDAETIGDYAFDGYTQLKQVQIEAGCTGIGSNAFRGCTQLEDVFFTGNAMEIAADAFAGVNCWMVYHYGDTTWEPLVGQNYGGNLNWTCWVETVARGMLGDIEWEIYEDNTMYLYGVGGSMEVRNSPEAYPWYPYAAQVEQIFFSAVTSVSGDAFRGFPALKRIVFDRKMASIGSSAFAGCSNLSDVSFDGNAPAVAEDAFANCPEFSLYYPEDNATWTPEVLAKFGIEPDVGEGGLPILPDPWENELPEITLPEKADCSITEQQAFERMDALREVLPEGMPFTNDHGYAWHGGHFSMGYGCAGFAFMLSDAAFGTLPARTVYDNLTIDNLRVGDILRVNNNTHSVIVMEIYENYIVIAEGNFNESVHWGRTMTAQEIADSTDYIMTRYAEHNWSGGSCTEPEICTVCGQEGKIAGHTWLEATCTAPKTCTTCGYAESTAAGHQWTPATCTAPKTCTACGEVEGTALGHTWQAATCTTVKTCTTCGATEGTLAAHSYTDGVCTACGRTQYASSGNIGTAAPTREQIIAAYQTVTKANSIFAQEPSVTAPYAAGQLSNEFLTSAITYLNFVRFVANLPAQQLSSTLNADAQHGAVVLAANDVLSHTPSKPADMDDDFYNRGFSATSSSNIHYNYGYPSLESMHIAVQSFMDDSGSNNLAQVGHRRWILNPRLLNVGFGYAKSTTNSNYVVMKVFDRSGDFIDYDFVAWPANNFPTVLIDATVPWSVSLNPEKYGTPKLSELQVTLTRRSDGKTWTFDSTTGGPVSNQKPYLTVDGKGMGEGCCIIFHPGAASVGTYSGVYEVRITGLTDKNGQATELNYVADFFDLEKSHEHSYTAQVTAPTCTTGGYTTYICECGNSYTDNHTDPLGHTWQDATCDQAKTCTVCGATEGAPLGHTWQDATCEKAKTCSRCGEVSGEPLGHDWDKVTCQEPKTCKRCGHTEGAAAGHTWADATCEAPKTCTVCGTTEGAPLDHTWQDATCQKPKTCSACGKAEGTTAGHQWTDATCDKAKTCTVCGATEGTPLGHSWQAATCEKPKTCSRCGITEGGLAEHMWSDRTVSKQPGYEESGEAVYTCNACKTTRTEVIPPLIGDYQIVKKEDKIVQRDIPMYDGKTGAQCNFDYTVPQNGATVLIFFSAYCGYSQGALSQLAQQEWLGNPYLNVVAVESKACNLGALDSFAKTCTPNAGDLINYCFTDTDGTQLMWDYFHMFSTANSLTWPVILVITEVDGVRTVQYGCPKATDMTYLYNALCSASEAFANYQAPEPHIHAYEVSQVVAPTCTAEGYTEYTCACGDVKQENIQAALGHTWQAATCEKAKTCTVCGATEGTALDHTWQAATCTKAKTCSVCGKTEGAPIAHSYDKGKCTVCGAVDENYKPAYKLGDVNGDGKINVTDAMVALRYAVKKITANDLNVEAADVNSDGKVNVTDAMQILRFAVKKITEFKPAK